MPSETRFRPLHESEIDRFRREAALFDAEASRALREATLFEQQARKHGYEADVARLVAEAKERDQARDLAANSEHRVYDFIQQVTEYTCEAAIQVLSRWSRLGRDPIVIRFSSPGGSVIHGLGLFDYILALREQDIHVTTATLGMAASMACILLQAGDARAMGKNAHILIHEVSSGAIGKLSELEDETKFARRLNERPYRILAGRSKVKLGTIRTRAKRKDWWLDADEALRLGFADSIGYGAQ